MVPAKTLKITRLSGPEILCIAGIGVVSIFAALFFSVQAGIIILLGAWTGVAALRYPKETFFILIFIAPLLPILKITEKLGALTTLKDFAIIVLFVKVVVYPILKKQDTYKRNNFLMPILIIAAVSVFSLLRADNTVIGALRLREIFLYAPLFWITRTLVSTPEDFKLFLKTIFAGVAFVLALAAIQYYFFADGMVLRFNPDNGNWIPRTSSTLAHPNNLGSYLILVLPVLVAFSGISNAKKMKFVILSIFGLIAIYMTYSRSAWIAIVVAISAVIALKIIHDKKVPAGKIFVTAIIAAAVVLLIPRTRTILKTTFDPNYASNNERIQILAGLVAHSTNFSAIFGNGFGDVTGQTGRKVNISLENIAAADVKEIRSAKSGTFVDNAVIKTWIETGFIGLLAVGWLIFVSIKTAYSIVRKGDLLKRVYAQGFIGVTAGLLVLSFFLDIPEVFPVALYWWTYAGLLEKIG